MTQNIVRASDDLTSGEILASDETFRHLHECVQQYAAILEARGYLASQAVRCIVEAVRDAVNDDRRHDAIFAAVSDWAAEAYAAARRARQTGG